MLLEHKNSYLLKLVCCNYTIAAAFADIARRRRHYNSECLIEQFSSQKAKQLQSIYIVEESNGC